jgi:hypothetical protein
MAVVLSLSAEEEAQFEAWAAQQGEAVQRDAHAVAAALAAGSLRQPLARRFFEAVALAQPIFREAAQPELGLGEYLLILLKTMTALHHADEGGTATAAKRSQRTPLDDAAVLYALGVASEATAARLARMSVEEFRFASRNRRRINLIRKQTRVGLTPSEEAELEQLQGEVRQYVDIRHPLPLLTGPGARRETHPPAQPPRSRHGDGA